MMDAIEVNTLRLGQVTLTSAQFEKSGAFYSQILGLKPLSSAEKSRTFGAGAVPLVTLIDDPAAKSFPRRPGLYHMAIRVPDRFWLARALYQLAERNYPLQGAADHGVSEAIYLADPEGNGIEIYRDRPRSEWPHQEDGSLEMYTEELNLEHLLFELRGKLEPWRGMPSGTDMGHFHLRVNDVEKAYTFYTAVIGMDLQMLYGNQAAFVSADGYHHHIGLNTWASRGAEAAPAGAAGLSSIEIVYPAAGAVAAIRERAEAAGTAVEETEQGLRLRDPSGNQIVLSVE